MLRISLKTIISEAHWKYAGNSWTNSDNDWFSRNPINQIQDSYEFMRKCDTNDSDDPRCKVWRVLFPSNADGITDIFDVKECFNLKLSRTLSFRRNNRFTLNSRYTIENIFPFFIFSFCK